ncbi:MAG: PhnD/SsuA/transferrin family substrate-binding protein [Rhizobiaceae bacterium]|nr:PhnD/SsuA/transferrin family substrate-binding protein [Rhizobiaceae bacterium]
MIENGGTIAALPMYDWPERHAEVDAQWATISDVLRQHGIAAPVHLARGVGDLLDFWKIPDLLFSQTCWGPMEQGLDQYVQVVGQQNYDGIEGGAGAFYSSAIVMRRKDAGGFQAVKAPEGDEAVLPIEAMRGLRLAYNVPDSMSGIIGLSRDLEAAGAGADIFDALVETGGHRGSIRAVAGDRADLAAIDCMSWALAQLYEPAAHQLVVVGWTAKRKGLPFITSNGSSGLIVSALRSALQAARLSA